MLTVVIISYIIQLTDYKLLLGGEKVEVYTVKEASEMLKISKDTLMKMLKNKTIHSVRAGARWIIPKSALNDYLEGN